MNDITKTIMAQLGGREFRVMVAAKNLCKLNDGRGIQLDFGKNASGANRLRVIYDEGTDTYTMQFWKRGRSLTPSLIRQCASYEDMINKTKPTLVKEYKGCYNDDLRRLFEDTTKLRTSLTHIYGHDTARNK